MIDPKDLVVGAVVTMTAKPIPIPGNNVCLEYSDGSFVSHPREWVARNAASVTPPTPPPPEPEVGDVWESADGDRVEIIAPPRTASSGRKVATWNGEWGYYAYYVSDLTLIRRAADRAATDGGEG